MKRRMPHKLQNNRWKELLASFHDAHHFGASLYIALFGQIRYFTHFESQSPPEEPKRKRESNSCGELRVDRANPLTHLWFCAIYSELTACSL